MTGISILKHDTNFQHMTTSDGRRINAEEYRELIVSRRSLVRTAASSDDLLSLRDTSTGETFLVDVDLIFSGRA